MIALDQVGLLIPCSFPPPKHHTISIFCYYDGFDPESIPISECHARTHGGQWWALVVEPMAVFRGDPSLTPQLDDSERRQKVYLQLHMEAAEMVRRVGLRSRRRVLAHGTPLERGSQFAD